MKHLGEESQRLHAEFSHPPTPPPRAAAIAYRLLPFEKPLTKAIHGSLHTAAVIMACLGLKATFATDNSYQTMDLSSAHSWIGIMGVTLYFANWAKGVLAFAFSFFPSKPVKKSTLPVHAILGISALVVTTMAIVTGIMEYNTYVSATEHYTGGIDNDPAEYYYELLQVRGNGGEECWGGGCGDGSRGLTCRDNLRRASRCQTASSSRSCSRPSARSSLSSTIRTRRMKVSELRSWPPRRWRIHIRRCQGQSFRHDPNMGAKRFWPLRFSGAFLDFIFAL